VGDVLEDGAVGVVVPTLGDGLDDNALAQGLAVDRRREPFSPSAGLVSCSTMEPSPIGPRYSSGTVGMSSSKQIALKST
jgi:hypothetical protein